jgi:hypothetical protein
MPLTDSKRKMNWSATSFNSTAIDGVKKIAFDNGITDLQEGADGDLGPTISIVTFQNPSFTVTTINAGILLSTAAGVTGVFTTTLNDARNRAVVGGFGIVFTTNNLSYIGPRGVEGDYNALASQNVTFKTSWTDGVTNPVFLSAA